MPVTHHRGITAPAHVILAMLTEGAGVPNGLFAECGVRTRGVAQNLLDALGVVGQPRATYLRQRQATERRQRAARLSRHKRER